MSESDKPPVFTGNFDQYFFQNGQKTGKKITPDRIFPLGMPWFDRDRNPSATPPVLQ